MVVIAETVGLSLVSTLIVKTYRLLSAIITKYREYNEDNINFRVRLPTQKIRLEVVQFLYGRPDVNERIAEKHRLFIEFILHELHSTLLKFVNDYERPWLRPRLIIQDPSNNLRIKIYRRDPCREIAQKMWWALQRREKWRDLCCKSNNGMINWDYWGAIPWRSTGDVAPTPRTWGLVTPSGYRVPPGQTPPQTLYHLMLRHKSSQEVAQQIPWSTKLKGFT